MVHFVGSSRPADPRARLEFQRTAHVLLPEKGMNYFFREQVKHNISNTTAPKSS